MIASDDDDVKSGHRLQSKKSDDEFEGLQSTLSGPPPQRTYNLLLKNNSEHVAMSCNRVVTSLRSNELNHLAPDSTCNHQLFIGH